MGAEQGRKRKQAVSALKRRLILDAARRVFERDGLEGASLRAIAAEAGYTPAALYFHFDSKEGIYAELLSASIAALQEAIAAAADGPPADRLRAAHLALFRFYVAHPRDLDLGFYLFRGGIRPQGLGRERNDALNAALEAALQPLGDAAMAMGASREDARAVMADALAHTAGLLLLAHTRRIRLFEVSAASLMEGYVERTIAGLTPKPDHP